MVITKVDVLQGPLGSAVLDHTEAKYTSAEVDVNAARARHSDSMRSAKVDADTIRQRRVLLWLADRPDGIYALEELYDGDGEAHLARRDVESLSQQGLVQPAMGLGPSLQTVQAGITPAGRRRAGELESAMRDQPARRRACREALLNWLYQADATDSARARVVTDLLRDDLSIFVAERFTDEEVDRASAWLARQDLIDGPTVDQAEGPVQAYLLDQGISCVEDYDGKIHDYREAMSGSRPGPASGPVFHVSGNVQIATGDRSQQTMNVTELPDQLVHVIDGIAQIVMALGLVSGQETQLEELRAQAIADVTSAAPNARAARRFGDWVIACVKKGGTAAVVAAVTAVASGMIQDAETLVHALGK